MNRVPLPAPYPRRSQTVAAVLFGWFGIDCLFGLPSLVSPGPDTLAMAITTVVFSSVIAVPVIAGVLRNASWLEGNILVVRGLVLTRRFDLSRAEIRLAARNEDRGFGANAIAAGRVPVLSVYDPQTRRLTYLRLREANGSLLDPARLIMLADAITSGKRPEPFQANAFWVANGLRQLARNPIHHVV